MAVSREPLWWYEPNTPPWDRLVTDAETSTDWAALEASASTGQRYHVVITRASGLQDRLGPYLIEEAVGLAYDAQQWDLRSGIPRHIEVEAL